MEEIVLAGATRTPIGRLGGALKDVPPEKLGVVVIQEVLRRTGLQPSMLDDVILGCVLQSNEAPNVARIAALLAGLPVEVTAYTVHRQCGSGLQAVVSAAQAIKSGEAEVVLAGGVESMTQAPYYLTGGRFGYRTGHALLYDPFFRNSEMTSAPERFGPINMGLTAEKLATLYSISREEQDLFALQSQEKAARALKNGVFQEEIVPVPVPAKGKEPVYFQVDEHPRPDTTLEKLARLPPAFKEGGTVTAGNSSGLNDGAAAMLVLTRRKAEELGIKPLGRLVAQAVAGVDPTIMGIGPVPAVKKALVRAGLKLEDIGLIELNEAFAAQAIAVLRELGLEGDERVNANGGAIALGHPVGATGAIILTKLLYEMQRRQVEYGLATLCIGGGQGIAVVVQRR